jgi:hypothetical protein
MMDDAIFTAWAAGFFDGEGCVLVNPRSNGKFHSLFTSITQQDPTALHLIKQRFGGNVTPDKTAASGSFVRKRGAVLVWRWKASSTEAYAFLKAIEPYCIVKAEQVRVALEFPEVGVKFVSRKPIPDAVRAKREQVMLSLRNIRKAQKVYLEAANG